MNEVTFIDFDEEWGWGPGVWSCNNCGATAEKAENIKHAKTCTPGESKKWQEIYQRQHEEEMAENEGME